MNDAGMRVIGGRLRGREIQGPPREAAWTNLRPTRERVREALFNFLHHGGYTVPPPPQGMRVLDLFSGTGALGIEALSRGAEWCTFVDTDPEARALIRRNLETLGLQGHSRVWRRDACDLARNHGAAFDLAFLDPPYGSDAIAQALHSALEGGWFAENALAAVECATRDSKTTPDGWVALFRREYGESTLSLLRRIVT